MEKKDAVISDVERNKEIFEYEMTEVLINLKGEFAVVRGEELNGENIGMTVEKVNVDYKSPQVDISAPDIVSSEISSISEYKPVKVASPQVGGIKIPQILKFAAPAKKLERGETPAQMMKRFEEEFVIPKTDTNRFLIKQSSQIKPEYSRVPDIGSLNISGNVSGQSAKLSSDDIRAGMPELKKNEMGRVLDKGIDIPKIKNGERDIKISFSTPFPSIDVLQKISVPKAGTVSPVAEIPIGSMDALKKSASDIDLSHKVAVEIKNVTDVNVPAYVPVEMDPLLTKDISVGAGVGMPIIDIEFKKPTFEDVEMDKQAPPALPDVPEKPDFSEYIADILDSLKA